MQITNTNKILQALVAYYFQLFPQESRNNVDEIMNEKKDYGAKIINIFIKKFSISNDNKTWESELNKLKEEIKPGEYSTVIDTFCDILNAIVRTNFYQKNKEYISFKIKPETIKRLPKPIPYAEIFVYNEDFEGCHLRDKPISRGGFRLSDRVDYRTEVLGLLKAQISKNAIIVPSGAKACFYIKKLKQCKIENADFIKSCYEKFVSGILDITDNAINEQITNPENTIIYDENDSYIVAAADKGTANFSDLANSISKKYNFWLQDAFASGGSNGYNHKQMGITSRGAYICAKSNFYELGIDIENNEISAIGIGDMAGDVFGNGISLFQKLKLIAAFNHIHIFIDPNPNIEKSANERKRLFKNPQLQWSDYDKSVISQGGGVFDRLNGDIELSNEIKMALDIPLHIVYINPEILINYILKTKVDLIWNGGIGTFIKSKMENNASVQDKFNDIARINGYEIRAKVVAEGGNVGATQLGRIEASSFGVKINMDAIDNSAGVSCSDHEVNIKIALSNIKINEESKNALLTSMTEDVTKLVLKDNYLQAKNIAVADLFKNNDTYWYLKLVQKMSDEKILDRQMQCIPSDDEFQEIITNKKSISRINICSILSHVKIYFHNNIIDSKIILDNYFMINDFLNYFPKQIQSKEYINGIYNHLLKKNIIATILANEIVNFCGITYIEKIQEILHISFEDIIKLYTIVRDLFGINKMFEMIYKQDFIIEFQNQANAIRKLQNNILSASIGIFNNIDFNKTIQENISILKPSIDKFNILLKGSCCSNTKTLCCFDEEYTAKLKLLKSVNVISICLSCKESNTSISDEYSVYMKISDTLNTKKVINYINEIIHNQSDEISIWNLIKNKYNTIIQKIIVDKIYNLIDIKNKLDDIFSLMFQKKLTKLEISEISIKLDKVFI